MRYLRVLWHHDHAEEPTELWSEIDDNSREIRKLEKFRDGSVGWADGDETSAGTRLGIEPLPPLDLISCDPEFRVVVITYDEFEQEWISARAVIISRA